MSFVQTLYQEIATAATQLEGIGNSFSAESSAAAPPTTAVAPAAADEVSALQAGVFSTYGQLYQTVSAQAQAVHQQFVNLLQSSSGSYGTTEAANQVAAASTPLSTAATSAQSGNPIVNGLNSLTTFLGGTTGNGYNLSNGMTTIPLDEMGNFASAYSDCIGMGGGGLLTALSGPASTDLGGLSAGLASSVSPAATAGAAGAAGAAGLGAAPVLAGVGQASAISGMSVPPSWAAGGLPAASAPVTLASQSWAGAAPHAGAVTTMPAGMPAAATAGRGGTGFGAPRYGIKPKVMPLLPKPTVT
jgi:hypothetical protein